MSGIAFMLELGYEPADIVLLFNEARMVVERGYPEWKGERLDLVAAVLKGTYTIFSLVHEPDGPWLAVCPVGDDAVSVMELPACAWAEKQAWEPFFRLSGQRDERGDWWLEEKDVTL